MKMPTRTLGLLIIAATLGAPAATAIESWCVEGACANYEDEAWGEGSCAESSDRFAYRGYSVTYDDGSSVTGAYVYQYCWTYDDGENSGEGNALSVAVTRLDRGEWRQDGAVLYWESSEWNGESNCETTLHTHAPAGLGDTLVLGCPAGNAPPMVLPALP